jgi:hypothetical protein
MVALQILLYQYNLALPQTPQIGYLPFIALPAPDQVGAKVILLRLSKGVVEVGGVSKLYTIYSACSYSPMQRRRSPMSTVMLAIYPEVSQ